MTQTEPEPTGTTDPTDTEGWTGATVRGRDGEKLGTLVEVLPHGSGARGRWGVVRSMLGKRRVVPLDGAADDGTGDLSVPTDRASVQTAPLLDDAATADADAESALHRHYTGRGVLADARELQHQRYGGSKLGSAFFGWLVAVGLTVLLGVLAGAVTAAVGADRNRTDAIVTVAVLIVGYYTGGYVAGRLARFDGARNGFLSWVVGLLATMALAVFGAFVGAQYDVLSRVQLPALPVAFGDVTIASLVLLAIAITGTLVAAVIGGKAGESFHRRVDRAAVKAL